jgi:hypothetical protein
VLSDAGLSGKVTPINIPNPRSLQDNPKQQAQRRTEMQG